MTTHPRDEAFDRLATSIAAGLIDRYGDEIPDLQRTVENRVEVEAALLNESDRTEIVKRAIARLIPTTPNEYVDVITSAGTVTVDLTASEDQGYIDKTETAGAAIDAVEMAFALKTTLLDAHGHPVRIKAGVVGYRYRRR